MTPLQTAARELIDRQTPGWVKVEPTSRSIEALRVALADEQAQAVEPIQRHLPENVARLLIEHYLKDEHGYADGSYSIEKQGYAGYESHSWAFWILSDDSTSYLHEDGRIEWCGTAWEPTEQAQAVEPMAWISKHGVVYPLDAKDEVHPINELQPLYLHPAPPPAMHLSEILAEKGIKLRTEFDPKPDHIVDSNKMVGERTGLIARLREAQVMLDYNPVEAHDAMGAAADMLEADADAYAQGRYDEQMAQGPSQAVWDEMNAQQVVVPQGAVPVPPCWYIEYKTHGQVTLRKDEADSAIENGAIRVIAYVCDTAQQVAVPAGYALVPLEPTGEMLAAAMNAPMPAVWLDSISARANLASSTQYKAMLKAAPQPPQGDKT